VRFLPQRPPGGGETDRQGDHREHDVEHLASMVHDGHASHTDGMPELLEAEMYRAAMARTVGGRIVAMAPADPLVVPEGAALASGLLGTQVRAVTRRGKVLLVDVGAFVVGLRFGMTGRLIVGEHDPIPALAYGPSASDRRFDRWEVTVSPHQGGAPVSVRLSDPRRLARVLVDPDLSGLGPDAMEVDGTLLAQRLAGRRGPIKSVLMDQHVVAGLGNLLVDELLWRSGIAPTRPTRDLNVDEIECLAAELRPMLGELMQRGGSHRGDLSVELRRAGALCPMDGAPLQRRNIGARTAWSCSLHQR